MKHPLILICLALSLASCQSNENQIRLGYLPNLTHAQALIGLHQKTFEQKFTNATEFKSRMFNAGPSIIEALFADEIDVAYVGPTPAINAYLRSHGEFVIIAGAAQGGGALLIPEGSVIQSLEDFKGKRILTPQLGNSQDVTARAFFKENGFDVDSSNGDLQILPIPNPDHINLFKKRDVDGSWTVEPWVSRLIQETNAQILLDESDVWYGWVQDRYSTTVLLVRRSLVEQKPEWVQLLLEAHLEITDWMNQHPDLAQQAVNEVLAEKWGKPLPDETMALAWKRMTFSWDLTIASLERGARNSKDLGFLRGLDTTLTGLIYDQPLLSLLIQRHQNI